MKLYEFQRNSVKWLLTLKRAILGSELGTGKTAVAIRACKALREKGFAPLVFVVVPASLKLNWVKEIEKWDTEETFQVINKKTDIIYFESGYVIFSYEVFSAIATTLTLCSVLILDESQKLKSKTAARTKNILFNYAIKIPRVYMLTGTPMPNSIKDAWTTFAFCSYGAIGDYWKFAYTYCYVQQTKWGKKVSGGKNLDKLAAMSKAFLRRDTVAEHLAELPDEQVIRIDLPHTKESKRYLTNPREEEVVRKLIEHEALELPEKAIALHIASQRRELGIVKVPQAVEFISDLLEQEEQVVVFAHHQDVINQLTELLGEEYNVASIFGQTPTFVRQNIVDNFQEKKLQCVVLGIQAAGVGITLTAARVSVHVEVSWVPADFEQAKARIRRIGQKNFCTHYVLQYLETIDETAFNVMQRKDKTIKKFWEGRK